jgi:hypothetical protein
MQLEPDEVRETLAEAWERWARQFNAPGGVAHTSADDIADRATSDATTLTPADAVTRFTECAEILRATPMSKVTVISYPGGGSTTLAIVTEVALMEATVHLLDLVARRADPSSAVPVIR